MKKILFTSFLSLTIFASHAQTYFTLNGYIKDKETNEALIGAAVFCKNSGKGTSTNGYGYYSLSVPKGESVIEITYVGYSKFAVNLNSQKDSTLTLYLSAGVTLNEVVVTSNYNNKLLSTQTSVEKLTSKTVNSLPVLLGESDILKSIQLLPGVTSGTEGSSGYNVRGGSSDQNLILIDGVPIYNAYHLYGFFSVFNTDAINDAKLYKGGIPARYGGRLSSVLDLRMKEGNANKFAGNVSIGLVSSKFMIEGPIFKGRTSFIITGRRSMTDLVGGNLESTLLKTTDSNKSDYFFYDVNAKVNHIFSERSRLFLSIYKGKDDSENSDTKKDRSELFDVTYSSKKRSNINWGNFTSVLRWNYLVSKNLFSNVTLYHTKYNYSTTDETFNSTESADVKKNTSTQYKRDYLSDVKDFCAKIDFDLNCKGNALKFGGHYVNHIVRPGISSQLIKTNSIESNVDTSYISSTLSHEAIIYFEDEFKPFNKLTCNAGVHLAGYFINGTVHKSVQPRVSCNFQLLENLSIKGSYSRMGQYLHLLSNSSLGLPTDLWVSSTEKIKPEYSNQYVFAIEHSLNKNFMITFELFKKDMSNLIAYKEGASYLVDKSNWYDKVEMGKGKSNGYEISINKETGKLTGWISYTHSKSVRQFENINKGKEFPFKYDRTHNLSAVLMYKLNEKHDFGATWVYSTGNAVTLSNEIAYAPLNRFEDQGTLTYYTTSNEYYNSVNGFRMPAYHRLDLCYNYHKKLRYVNYTLSAGAYNVYNRRNPYYLYYEFNLDGVKIAQQSLFPVLPYISFTLKF